ncbi:MAG: hypothetical protein PHH14_02240 [Candidatus Margulisbacteria bacterium]|nr:hypothetical protein [Candidatus Margulisiibacteriota bacterium]
MSILEKVKNISETAAEGTGGLKSPNISKIFTYPFGQYEIKIALTEKNEFIGISEIKVNKSFLEYKNQSTPTGYHDVEQYYLE